MFMDLANPFLFQMTNDGVRHRTENFFENHVFLEANAFFNLCNQEEAKDFINFNLLTRSYCMENSKIQIRAQCD